jgi:hypothetical protein
MKPKVEERDAIYSAIGAEARHLAKKVGVGPDLTELVSDTVVELMPFARRAFAEEVAQAIEAHDTDCEPSCGSACRNCGPMAWAAVARKVGATA